MWKQGVQIGSLLVLFTAVLFTVYKPSTDLIAASLYKDPPMSVRSALDPHKGTLLAPLLKPRVPGTEGALKARAHIVDHLKKFGWNVQVHDFEAATPKGPVKMANILANLPRKSDTKPEQLTLAAHYDSKELPRGFVGAIDSAFPCALMLWLASRIREKKPETSFDLIFFDGEEAFHEWSDDDSLYGARQLAAHQADKHVLPSTLVLLDLIGYESRFPIPSWFPQTHHLHKQLAAINPQLVGGRPLHQYAGKMLDDHIPYLKKGVPVLHLIPPSFPEQWHTLDDNVDLLDWKTMEGWADMMEKWLFEPLPQINSDYDW